MGDWISGDEAAEIIGAHRSTVWRSLRDPEQRAEWWGEEGKGWRRRPLLKRPIYEVSRKRAEEIRGPAE
jgi:hypothetical protein